MTWDEVSGAEVVGAEVTRGRGGSGAKVSVNRKTSASKEAQILLIFC